MSQAKKVGESQLYWTHGVDAFPSPVAQFRMSQLIDMDDRLYETARIVYRFMVGWYHDSYGDALLSQRHIAKVMKLRAPEGAVVPSRNAVQRAIIALMDTGWVVRSFQGRGKGKGASRYVPVVNVLELAAQGRFPEPAHSTGPVQPAHSTGPVVAHSTGPVEAEPAHANGPKTLPPDTASEPMTGWWDSDFAPPAHGLSASAAAKGDFEDLYRAYGVRRDIADARRAYEKLNPDAKLHQEMIVAAKAWRDAAGTIERMGLRRWIEEERYKEDPKGERKPRPAREKPTVRPSLMEADNDNGPMVCDVGPFSPTGTWNAEIVDTAVERVDDNTERVIVHLSCQSRVGSYPIDLVHTLYSEHPDEAVQRRGQEFLAELGRLVGETITDTDQLHGKKVACTVNDKLAISYRAAA